MSSSLVAGRIEVLGREPAAARREVAYLPPADTLDAEFPVTAGQVVPMGRYRRVGWLRRPGRADRDAADSALAAVGLADRSGDRFGALSGGQRQRVLLAARSRSSRGCCCWTSRSTGRRREPGGAAAAATAGAVCRR